MNPVTSQCNVETAAWWCVFQLIFEWMWTGELFLLHLCATRATWIDIYTGQWRSLSCHMQHYLNLFHVPSGGFVGAPEGEMT